MGDFVLLQVFLSGLKTAMVGLIQKKNRVVLSLLCLVLGLAASASGARYSLFVNDLNKNSLSSELESVRPSHFKRIRRFRPVNLAPAIQAQHYLMEGDILTLDLFGDAAYTAQIDRINTNINGTVSIRARISDFPQGYLLISTTDSQSLASIRIPEQKRHFCIYRGRGVNAHYLFDMDANGIDQLEDAPSLTPPLDKLQESGQIEISGDAAADGPLDPANVDVMIVYTPAAKSWAGGTSGIANIIAQAMEKAQLALDNSDTSMTLTLVHSAEVTYTESGTASTDLDRLTYTAEGYMDQVHTWRDMYKADLVQLFAVESNVGGIGWQLYSTSGDPAYAFSLVRVQQAGWTYTSIHEMGHNMGCHHHKEQNVQPGPGLSNYSAGWRWIGTNSGKYCSIMTYEEGEYFSDGQTHTRVAYFSNPDILHQGVATGDAADGDNARTLREIKHVIASYRIPTGSLQVDLSPQGAIDVGAQWRRVGTSTWYNSEAVEEFVSIGTHTIEFKDTPGWAKPDNQAVSISENQLTLANGVYSIAPEIIIGTGTSSWYYPLSTFYNDARTQTIYLSSEIGTPRNIISLGLYVAITPGQTMNNFTIRMKHTDLSAYGSSPQWESTDWMTVYQANQTITTTGWVQFNFSAPFVYNGNQNLMVDISFNNDSYSSNGECRYSTPGGQRTISAQVDSTYGDPLSWSGKSPKPTASSNVPNIKLITTVPQKVEQPVFTPDGGIYTSTQNVVITCDTPGAAIHYTTNGVDPTESDPVIESGASVLVDQNLTLKAAAWKTGLVASDVAAAAYEIVVSTPVFTPDGGTFSSPQSVLVSCDTPDAVIHFTVDGKDPNQSDPVIESGSTILVNRHMTLKAGAWKTGLTSSSVKAAAYDIPLIIFVRTDGSDNNDGLSWASAKQTVQEALDAASVGDEIWAACGIYKPTLELYGSGERYKTFQLKNGVALYGGFAGTENVRNQRNWAANPTILSGDLDGNGQFGDGDAYHVLFHPAGLNLDNTAVIDGFVITGGHADGTDNYGMGAGMCNIASSPAVTNCLFKDNWAFAAGAVLNWSGSPNIVNCIFNANTADFGSAIFNYENASPWIINCTIFGNISNYNAALINDTSSNSIITNCILWNNTSPDGLQISDYNSVPVVTYCDIEGGYAGAGNINLPPLFTDDVHGDLSLQTGSPCIDAGNNAAVPVQLTTDLAGETRFIDGNCDANPDVDMGAYEYYMIGDLDMNCGVNIGDFNLFSQSWLRTNCQRPDNCNQADFDRNGAVDLADLQIFAAGWLEGK